MAFNPTPSQELAINSKGNILVAAAAGSGKTAVLVERVIRMLTDSVSPVSAEKLLIVTFTEAATAEMRLRIERRLDEEYLKTPENIFLLKQRQLIKNAKICTIDSFCIELVRENFEKFGISPDFKIAQEEDLLPYNRKVIYEIINRYFDENNGNFNRLLDVIGTEYSEENFVEFIFEIYKYSTQLPFPREWFKNLADQYSNPFDSNNLWYSYCFKTARGILSELISAINGAIELLYLNENAYEAYNASFCALLEELKDLYSVAIADKWDEFYTLLNRFYLPELTTKGVSAFSKIPEISAAKTIFKSTLKGIERLAKLFCYDEAFVKCQFAELKEPVKLLCDILLEFDTAVFEEYKSRNTFTFHNLEHMALDLLCKNIDGKLTVREEAKEIINSFEEVLIDEYQDTNDLQNLIFTILSDNEKKLFTVGDVKQSIYGFRGANPINFLNMKNSYLPIDIAVGNMHQKIVLGQNFRSKDAVCDFINDFFGIFMTEKTGKIVYNWEEELVSAAKFPSTNLSPVDFVLTDCKDTKVKPLFADAKAIADYIKRVMGEGAVIKADDNTLRPAKFSDFTILLRNAKNKAPILAEELRKFGIPTSYAGENFADSYEVLTFINFLKVIDNPLLDVEMLSVLLSPIFDFSIEEVAQIRAESKNSTLYSAMILASENRNEKAKKFLEKLSSFRILAAVTPLESLVSTILHKTKFLDTVSLMPNGRQKRENLLLLIDFSKTLVENCTSLTAFAKKIESLKDSYKNPLVQSGESVSIMSIHGSKGLQFPVCIIADLSAVFNDQEAKSASLYSKDLGIGFKYFDEALKEKVTTVGREVILDNIRATRSEEELRLLYVAMTRAEDKLCFISSHKNLEKKTEDLTSLLIASNSQISSFLFSRTSSYADWLILFLLLHKDGEILRQNGHSLLLCNAKSDITLSVGFADDFAVSHLVSDTNQPQNPDERLVNDIKAALSYEYPYKKLSELQSKASVSALANSAESAKFAFSAKPSFLCREGLSATQRGTGMHKIMQFFDFSRHNNIEEELDRLYEWQYISEAERDAADISAIKKFFSSDIFSRMENSLQLEREMRFLTEVEAYTVMPDIDKSLLNEKIVIQGAVDICFVEDDGVVVLDFKTDRVDNKEALAQTYGEQLNIYAIACEKIFYKKVKQKIIYSFALGCEIEV